MRYIIQTKKVNILTNFTVSIKKNKTQAYVSDRTATD